MKEPLVSVIVPVYNAQPYISECIESVLRQTYTNWELLLINDGSSDQTPELLDHYRKLDARIVIYHQRNSGVSAARNRGLDNAHGEFVAFLDADDLLPPDSLENRVKGIVDADLLVAGGAAFAVPGLKTPLFSSYQNKTWSGEEALENIAVPGEYGYQGYCWNKLFRRQIIAKNNIRFAERIAYNEDRLFCVTYALFCNRANLFNAEVYWYRQTEGGAMGRLKAMKDSAVQRIMTEFEAYEKMLELVKDEHPLCCYRLAEEAQYRACVLKRAVSKRERRLCKAFNGAIRKYGFIALRAPKDVFPVGKKIRIIWRMILLY